MSYRCVCMGPRLINYCTQGRIALVLPTKWAYFAKSYHFGVGVPRTPDVSPPASIPLLFHSQGGAGGVRVGPAGVQGAVLPHHRPAVPPAGGAGDGCRGEGAPRPATSDHRTRVRALCGPFVGPVWARGGWRAHLSYVSTEIRGWLGAGRVHSGLDTAHFVANFFESGPLLRRSPHSVSEYSPIDFYSRCQGAPPPPPRAGPLVPRSRSPGCGPCGRTWRRASSWRIISPWVWPPVPYHNHPGTRLRGGWPKGSTPCEPTPKIDLRLFRSSQADVPFQSCGPLAV